MHILPNRLPLVIRATTHFCTCVRAYSAKATSTEAVIDMKKTKPKAEARSSSCPENTILTGLNYFKGQPPVFAKKDDEYPSWLWDLLRPKQYPDDGPGGVGEKMRLRASNKQRIKEQNFLKTQ